MNKIGFIGCGKMATAIINGLINTGIVNASQIMATQADINGLEDKSKELGIKIILDNKILVKENDIVFIAVKPSQVLSVLEEIGHLITPEKLVISIAAGINIKKLEEKISENNRVIRVMPNTPVLVGEGMFGIYGGVNATIEDIEYVKLLFSSVGKCLVLRNEQQLDIVTAISGSGPAFFYKVMNDIALAGEKLGLDYEKALLLSIQTAIGSAKMALNREVSMNELISNVATKGGCTRVGVDVMEEEKVEQIFEKVIVRTTQKASELGR